MPATPRATRTAGTLVTPRTPSTRAMKPVIQRKTVNFAPYELQERDTTLTRDQHTWLRDQWAIFKVKPYGDTSDLIGDMPFSVPYNGEKSRPTLMEVTGKKQFDFFAYSFVIPDGDGTVWDIMWDYETGMSKPAETFKGTPGLASRAVNITGGRIEIQGFWIPYDAALALCSRFTYPIRAVLYPLFGPAILRQALHPHHPKFENWSFRRPTAHIEPEQPHDREDTPMRDDDGDYHHHHHQQQLQLSTRKRARPDDETEERLGASPNNKLPRPSPGIIVPRADSPAMLERWRGYEARDHECAMTIILLSQKERLKPRIDPGPFRSWSSSPAAGGRICG
ncbi:hypothetical protein ANO11243_078660 [Dothideomycetidae sp. 11243]|nr:hypothetical protein ANO11243_078660 [fungal sp. No.11243]